MDRHFMIFDITKDLDMFNVRKCLYNIRIPKPENEKIRDANNFS